MNKKSLLFGLLVVAAAVFIFTGCPTEAEIEYRDKEVEKIVEKDKIIDHDVLIHIDTLVSSQGDLENALEEEYYEGKVIGYNGSSALSGQAVTIPEGYTVYIQNSGNLETASGAGLTVEGTLWVGYGARLTIGTGGDPIVVDGGAIHAVTGSTISIDVADSVQDTNGDTVLGTPKVSIVNGALIYSADSDFTAASDIQTALGYITSGYLSVGNISSTGIKPSDLQSLSIPTNKAVAADTGTTAETAASLTIPASLFLTTSDTLGIVETLTVNGTLTASSATLASGGAALNVGAQGSASIDAATLLTSTVAGELTLNGDLTLDTGAVLSIANPGRVSGDAGTEVIKANASGASITIGTGGDAYPGFTTTATGVIADDLGTILLALQEDGTALIAAGNKVTVTSTGATAVTDAEGTAITLSSAIATGTGTATASSDNDNVPAGNITLSVSGTALELADTGYADNGNDETITITFDDLKLQIDELITPSMPGAISVALTTDY